MLACLHIRDFVIVDSLELELEPGMTVLTGETGAGKSILVDALGLAVGDRASGALVRPEREQAEVTAVFEPGADSPPAGWLAEHELEDPDGHCILRRCVRADGRSRAFVNGRHVPVQLQREIGGMLVDVFGQHQHQSLFQHARQRQILDQYGGHEALLEEVSGLHARWRSVTEAIAEQSGSDEDSAARLDYIRFQMRELEALGMQPGEISELTEEQRRLAYAQDILSGCARVLANIDDDSDTCVRGLIGTSLRTLGELSEFDSRISECRRLLESVDIELNEVAAGIRHCADDIDPDPERLRRIDERLAMIQSLARKHRVSMDKLPDVLAALETAASACENREERLQALEQERRTILEQYRRASHRLHASRVESAADFSRQVTRHLRALGMPDGRLEVAVEEAPGQPPTSHGSDRIEIMVCVNRGQPMRPMTQVASGGELSRIGLAIQVVQTLDHGPATLVFDEVDAGIGGAVAEVVGSQLRALGDSRQVLCVTHLPQVASRAGHHLQVTKHAGAAATTAVLESLTAETRVKEIARMLGGIEITDRSMAHAREMLHRE